MATVILPFSTVLPMRLHDNCLGYHGWRRLPRIPKLDRKKTTIGLPQILRKKTVLAAGADAILISATSKGKRVAA